MQVRKMFYIKFEIHFFYLNWFNLVTVYSEDICDLHKGWYHKFFSLCTISHLFICVDMKKECTCRCIFTLAVGVARFISMPPQDTLAFLLRKDPHDGQSLGYSSDLTLFCSKLGYLFGLYRDIMYLPWFGYD